MTDATTWRAFLALIWFSFRRQARVRQMAWTAVGLLTLLAIVVAVMSHGPTGWGLPDRYSNYWKMRIKEYPRLLDQLQMIPTNWEASLAFMAITTPFRAMMNDAEYLNDWAFLNFSRWVVFTMHLGFLMPLFTLAFASAGFGQERESRTMLWLLTRPLPPWAIYLGKYLGSLPWCLLGSMGGFLVLCLVGGSQGWRAFLVFWPGILAGTLGLSALFHLLGAVVRRPAIVGLVYIFFFETVVANLPGSLKQLSLNYYTRSILYQEATQSLAFVRPEQLEVYQPVTPETAWLTILLVMLGLTLLGMFAFRRQEPSEET